MLLTLNTKWEGSELKIETGRLAMQANGSALVSIGQTTVLCVVVVGTKTSDTEDFTDMTVFYQERFYAAGKIPGGFIKREGKPSDKETLISRIIDRSLRPVVKLRKDQSLQITCTVLSYDGENMPDLAALIGATTAVKLAGINCETVIGTRICLSDNKLIINPKFKQIETSDCEMFISGTSDVVTMLECEAFEKSAKQILDILKNASKTLAIPMKFVNEFVAKCGIQTEETIENKELTALIKRIKKSKAFKELITAFEQQQKKVRYAEIKLAEQKITDNFKKSSNDKLLHEAISELKHDIVRNKVILHKTRIDGRGLNDIRPILCETKVLPRVHGSALFKRGETQVLSVVTLGSRNDMQTAEDITSQRSERFMLHYNFPSYSVGEIGAVKGVSRREIGHGNLAKKAIIPILPPPDKNSTAIRAVAEVLECNGSSSMASVCATSLALMDAGIQIKKHVAGIAMGMIQNENENIILSDIMADEDHLGDMDFKLAGTLDGITALQMDTKTNGVKYSSFKKIIHQAIVGVKFIIARMHTGIISARDTVSDNAPKIVTIKIDKDHIRTLIGPGGKTIKEIIAASKAKIDIQDDGTLNISGATQDIIDIAIAKINTIVSPFRVGEMYDMIVTKVAEFGIFVKLQNDAEGFVHVSDLSDLYVESIEKNISVGQQFSGKMIGFDRSGKVKLTMKSDTPKEREPEIETPIKVPAKEKKRRFF